MSRRGKLRKLKPLKAFLPGFWDKIGLSDRLNQQKAVLVWNQAVGQDIRKHTSANRIEQNILYVAVSSPIWMNELVYLKTGIIKKLNELVGQEVVKNIKFYLK